MRDFPTDPMRQYQQHFDALLTDWHEAGKITRVTPRADRVREISRQLHAVSTEREPVRANNVPGSK